MEDQERIKHERSLKHAVLAGDETAWQVWYDATWDNLYRYILWRCGGLRDHADEVVQDTWLVAVRRLEHFDPDSGSFLGWLRGIAANLLRNRFRQSARREACVIRAGREADEPPDASALRQEQNEQVALALARLPEHYEEVLRAHYLDELSVPEIALARAESPKAVESLLVRARNAFRQTFSYPE